MGFSKMSKLYIAEYLDTACTEPAHVEQTVEIGAESTASAPLGKLTKAVRLHADTPCSLKFGAYPVATTSNQRLAGNSTETKIVAQGASHRIGVIANADEAEASFSLAAVNEQLKARGIQ
jgi:hypothetical protein